MSKSKKKVTSKKKSSNKKKQQTTEIHIARLPFPIHPMCRTVGPDLAESFNKIFVDRNAPPAGSRFDYVAYDEQSQATQDESKRAVQLLEKIIDSKIKSPRAKALAHTKLEEVYMWIGKGIRDDQIQRNGSATLMEQRKNG